MELSPGAELVLDDEPADALAPLDAAEEALEPDPPVPPPAPPEPVEESADDDATDEADPPAPEDAADDATEDAADDAADEALADPFKAVEDEGIVVSAVEQLAPVVVMFASRYSCFGSGCEPSQ
jgi:hypothetical protein